MNRLVLTSLLAGISGLIGVSLIFLQYYVFATAFIGIGSGLSVSIALFSKSGDKQ